MKPNSILYRAGAVRYLWAVSLALSGLMFIAPLHAAPLSPVEVVPVPPMTASPVTLTPLPATSPTMSAAEVKTYVLSPDDVVEITVLGHEDLKAEVTILPDGTFDYPILGIVHAAGQTVAGLTKTLSKGLSKNYNQPEVTVYLRQGRLRRISVLGTGIRTSGQFEFRTGMHLLDMVTAGGGLSEDASLIDAKLVTGGGQQMTTIHLGPLMGGDMTQNLPLAPGDVLILTAGNPEIGEVQLEGQVAKPGSYNIMPSGISILALLNQAGGALPTARLTKVQIKHDGMVRIVDLLPLLNTDLSSEAGNIRLVPGDEILIPQNKNIVLALGEVRSTGVLSIPDDQPLTLTKAYALVGGATPDGDKKNVNVIRRTPSGKAQLLSINMEDVLKGKNGVTDVTLEPDDILFVQKRNKPLGLNDILSSLGSLSSLAYIGRTYGIL